MQEINENSKKMLKIHIESSINTKGKISFFILSWPKDIWKSQISQDISKEIMWDYFSSDFLHIKDFSSQIWKKHNLKIEYKDSEISKTLQKDYNYKDIGTREINSWLQRSPVWKFKILLIENIERMTIWAINAFLKTCEEPLQNRIIIATTSSNSQLLDTINSRAIVISFYPYSQTKIKEYAQENNMFTNYPDIQDFACFMSMWSPSTLQKIKKIFDSDSEFPNLIKRSLSVLSWNQYIHKKQKIIDSIKDKWIIEEYLDWLISYYISIDDFLSAKKWLKIKNMSMANVNIDNLLFYWLLN